MKKLLLASTFILALSAPAQSYDRNTLVLGLGLDNLRDSDSDSNDWQALEGRVELRGKSFNSLFGLKNFSPMIGAEVDTQGAAYVYGGLLYDWNFYDRWSLVPNISAGAYRHGDGKDLGGWFEFHDSIELNYRFDQASRLGIELTHMSNASIYNHNPGKEDLMLHYSLGL